MRNSPPEQTPGGEVLFPVNSYPLKRITVNLALADAWGTGDTPERTCPSGLEAANARAYEATSRRSRSPASGSRRPSRCWAPRGSECCLGGWSREEAAREVGWSNPLPERHLRGLQAGLHHPDVSLHHPDASLHHPAAVHITPLQVYTGPMSVHITPLQVYTGPMSTAIARLPTRIGPCQFASPRC
jgi:hypothetical protein